MPPFFAFIRPLWPRRRRRLAGCWLLLMLFTCLPAQAMPMPRAGCLAHTTTMSMSPAAAPVQPPHEQMHPHGACHCPGGGCANSLPAVSAALGVAWLASMPAGGAWPAPSIPQWPPQPPLRPPAG